MTPPRKPGRPRLDAEDVSVSVHFRLPTKQYDATVQRASQERLTLGDFIRRCLSAPQHDVSSKK
jgi:hypothetical protein